MILGIGTDLVDTNRIAKTLARFGKRFERRCFTEAEIARADQSSDRVQSIAKRYAAKEAIWKALGEGPRDGIRWRDLEVRNARSGKPRLNLAGKAAERLSELTPPGMTARIDLSLTDEPPLAMAFVVVSAAPSEWERSRPGEGA